jgi:tryptophan-rich sensory protein
MPEHLPLQHPWAWALATCAVAAGLEGVGSGTKVSQRFAQLRLPQPALPLWAWSLIGLAYYVLFSFLLHSLFGEPPTPFWTAAALAIAAVLLVMNAAWNWVFFRKQDLWLSFILFVPYVLVALVLAVVLVRIRSQMAGWYLLYVGYLGYATWWGYGTWRLNSRLPHG